MTKYRRNFERLLIVNHGSSPSFVLPGSTSKAAYKIVMSPFRGIVIRHPPAPALGPTHRGAGSQSKGALLPVPVVAGKNQE